ncbi:alpha/beta hydrolase [Amycolatopsis sp. Poz14]|uniref:alpha/beta hydrolase n=1 Tax=Amycolatopsis sp. Poz14 TaxID=1447705 RepID=UPI001EE86612|nr:alpha/beta hydrolase [Amycolatopsis sp. Poz14]MCG3751937.1 alpha/beta hydrolase [Amycolatopsis sp. Poz14]
MTTGTAMATPGATTEYFEIDSTAVGARFAVSVFLPRGYEGSSREYPLVYATDGNLIAPLTEGVRGAITDRQQARPVEPYLQVNVGYVAADAPRQLVLRNRDLVPPGEGVPDFMRAHIRRRLGVESGAAPESMYEEFFAQQKNARADNFLAFLETELHREISARYRFRADDVGLFGYSYGGLFTLFALTSGSSLFTRFGAGSPGVVVPDSRIYERYEKLLADTESPVRETFLHLTVNAYEMLGPSQFYRHLGIEFLRFLDVATERPLPGLRVSTELIADESHSSGIVDAYRSFLRTCYPGAAS